MTVKKHLVLAFVFVLSLILSLAACNNDGDTESPVDNAKTLVDVRV